MIIYTNDTNPVQQKENHEHRNDHTSNHFHPSFYHVDHIGGFLPGGGLRRKDFESGSSKENP